MQVTVAGRVFVEVPLVLCSSSQLVLLSAPLRSALCQPLCAAAAPSAVRVGLCCAAEEPLVNRWGNEPSYHSGQADK